MLSFRKNKRKNKMSYYNTVKNLKGLDLGVSKQWSGSHFTRLNPFWGPGPGHCNKLFFPSKSENLNKTGSCPEGGENYFTVFPLNPGIGGGGGGCGTDPSKEFGEWLTVCLVWTLHHFWYACSHFQAALLSQPLWLASTNKQGKEQLTGMWVALEGPACYNWPTGCTLAAPSLIDNSLINKINKTKKCPTSPK